MENSCRLCLEVGSEFLEFFHGKGLQENICSIITKHFWFQPTKDDQQSHLICLKCWTRLKDFHDFFREIEIAQGIQHTVLSKQIVIITSDEMKISEQFDSTDQNQINLPDLKISSIKNIKENSTHLLEVYATELKRNAEMANLLEADIKLELSDFCSFKEPKTEETFLEMDSADFSLTESTIKDQSLQEIETEIISLENEIKLETDTPNANEFPFENIENHSDSIAEVDSSGIEIKTEPPTNYNDFDEIMEIDSIQETEPANITIKTELPIEIDDTTKLNPTDHSYGKIKLPLPKTQRELEVNRKNFQNTVNKYEDEDRRIQDFFNLECNLCKGHKFETFFELKKHFRIKHLTKYGYVICCNKKIRQRSLLLDHLKWHENPAIFQCSNCEVKCMDRKSIRMHMALHETDKQKDHRCHLCGIGYESIYNLKQHLSVVHKIYDEHKCNGCDKSFKTVQSLELHIYLKHTTTGQRRRIKPSRKLEKCKASFNENSSLKYQKVHTTDQNSYVQQQIKKQDQPSTTTIQMPAAAITASTTTNQINADIKYICPYCPSIFNSKMDMYNHWQQTHPEKWFQRIGMLPPATIIQSGIAATAANQNFPVGFKVTPVAIVSGTNSMNTGSGTVLLPQ